MTKECKVLMRNELVMVVDFDGKEIQMPSDHTDKDIVFVKYENDRFSIVDKLEKEISNLTVAGVFSREGDSYQRNYPIVLNIIDLFYKMLMPVFFTLINSVRIYKEWMLLNKVYLALICDTVLFVAIFIITWFYFFEIHPKITDFCKKHIPFVDSMAKILRKVLKEV